MPYCCGPEAQAEVIKRIKSLKYVPGSSKDFCQNELLKGKLLNMCAGVPTSRTCERTEPKPTFNECCCQPSPVKAECMKCTTCLICQPMNEEPKRKKRRKSCCCCCCCCKKRRPKPKNSAPACCCIVLSGKGVSNIYSSSTKNDQNCCQPANKPCKSLRKIQCCEVKSKPLDPCRYISISSCGQCMPSTSACCSGLSNSSKVVEMPENDPCCSPSAKAILCQTVKKSESWFVELDKESSNCNGQVPRTTPYYTTKTCENSMPTSQYQPGKSVRRSKDQGKSTSRKRDQQGRSIPANKARKESERSAGDTDMTKTAPDVNVSPLKATDNQVNVGTNKVTDGQCVCENCECDGNDALTESNMALNSTKNELDAKNRALKSVETQAALLTEENTNIRRKLNNLEDLESKLNSLSEENKDLKTSLKKSNDLVESLKSELNGKTDDTGMLELSMENRTLKESIEQLKETNKKLIAEKEQRDKELMKYGMSKSPKIPTTESSTQCQLPMNQPGQSRKTGKDPAASSYQSQPYSSSYPTSMPYDEPCESENEPVASSYRNQTQRQPKALSYPTPRPPPYKPELNQNSESRAKSPSRLPRPQQYSGLPNYQNQRQQFFSKPKKFPSKPQLPCEQISIISITENDPTMYQYQAQQFSGARAKSPASCQPQPQQFSSARAKSPASYQPQYQRYPPIREKSPSYYPNSAQLAQFAQNEQYGEINALFSFPYEMEAASRYCPDPELHTQSANYKQQRYNSGPQFQSCSKPPNRQNYKTDAGAQCGKSNQSEQYIERIVKRLDLLETQKQTGDCELHQAKKKICKLDAEIRELREQKGKFGKGGCLTLCQKK